MQRTMSLHSRRKLKRSDIDRFAHAEPALFRELAKVVCRAGMLPQKELHECWQMANIVNKNFPESLRVADLAAGHGLLAWILVLLARSNEIPVLRTAVAVDINRPKSADALALAITDRWPSLRDSVHYVEGSIDVVIAEDGASTLLVAAHACGSLSDRVLMAAITSRNSVAIMPCCHSLRKQSRTLSSLALASGLPSPSIESISSLAVAVGQSISIDQFRIDALAALGYDISEDSIEAEITAFNRIIMGKTREPHPHNSSSLSQISEVVTHAKRLGETRAYENVHVLNISSIKEAEALSKRPSREWLRSFDLSYWVDNESLGKHIAAALEFLIQRFLFSKGFESLEGTIEDDYKSATAVFEYLLSANPVAPEPVAPELVDDPIIRNITILDQYTDPATRRLAFTYRIELRSLTVGISKADAILLRRSLCRTLNDLSSMFQENFEWRGGPL